MVSSKNAWHLVFYMVYSYCIRKNLCRWRMLKNVEIGLLNDYYGGLLTEYQTRILSSYYDEDLSLKEIAEEEGVSRQAVQDVIKRSSDKLVEYEEKLGLVEKITNIVNKIEQIIVSVDTEVADKLNDVLNEIKEI